MDTRSDREIAETRLAELSAEFEQCSDQETKRSLAKKIASLLTAIYG